MTILEVDPPPPPVWERSWQSGHVHHFQALYKIDGSPDPPVGVRVTVVVDTIYPDKQSYATAEIFNGAMWNTVSGLPAELMKCIRNRAPGTARFDLDGLARDVTLLLRDAQWAWDYRVRGRS